ncbi:MAG: hypothetical protein AAF446_08265 [Pseudomonadota bacterium]
MLAFDSGSTGADGAFNPTVDSEIALPADGVFNFTELNIPAGVTVTFTPNALNTPVTILVSGDATIDGTIDVSGFTAAPSVGAGDGNVGDDGLPGRGGPGGFAGGRGGAGDPSDADNGPRMAQSGLGPGGGIASTTDLDNQFCYGSGGAFATQGEISSSCRPNTFADAYGNPDLLPLVGGSGGSGGHGGSGTVGSGGGGGGGALLLAVSGTLTINGQLLADGGSGGDLGHDWFSNDFGSVGAGGSGGAIRLVATTISGNGGINAIGGTAGSFSNARPGEADGGNGRIRLEAESLLFAQATDPSFTTSEPGELFVVGLPEIRIASVAGIAAPASPTGNADIILPSDTPNPVEVVIESVNVPLGNTLTVILTPPAGEPVETISTALQGMDPNGVATASVNLPDGGSVLLATLSFSVADSPQRFSLSRYTDGEPVVHVQLAASMSGESQTILTTESGRTVVVQQPAS